MLGPQVSKECGTLLRNLAEKAEKTQALAGLADGLVQRAQYS
jgi:hypothetical protein